MTSRHRSPWFSLWDLLPLFVAVALAVALPALLRGLPDPMPTHFDGHGHPNGWTPHAAFPWLCFGLPAFVWLMLLVTGRAFVGSSQDPEGRKSEAMVPLRGLLATGFLALMGAVPLIPRFGLGVMGWAVALLIGLLVLGLGLAVCKLKAETPLDGQGGLYRWGLFYVNPEDPRVWVPKRLGVGWTLNFAHATSWFILVLLLSPLAIIGMALAR